MKLKKYSKLALALAVLAVCALVATTLLAPPPAEALSRPSLSKGNCPPGCSPAQLQTYTIFTGHCDQFIDECHERCRVMRHANGSVCSTDCWRV